MKKYTHKELQEILDLHGKWLKGLEGSRADLRGADLSGANLSHANLSGADLSDANLRGADLRGADLRGADLSGANLSHANLSGADLSDANLRGADLRGADLRGADLRGADLRGANLRDANLWNLTGNRLHIKTIALERYTITYTSIYLQIGCQRHTYTEWANFDDAAISRMDSSALEWWQKWKETIFKLIEMSPAEPTLAAGDKS